MNVNLKLKEVAHIFGMSYNSGNYKYVLCSKRDIIISNFLGGCPDPFYTKHGNQKTADRHKNLTEFLESSDFKTTLKGEHGRVMYRSNIIHEAKIARKIKDKKLKYYILNFYKKLKNKLADGKALALTHKPAGKKDFLLKEILLHEYIHMLLDDNKIRAYSWKWDEGLVTYMFHFILKRSKFKRKPKTTKNKMGNIYGLYAYRWANLLRDIESPKERKKVILGKIRSINKSFNYPAISRQ